MRGERSGRSRVTGLPVLALAFTIFAITSAEFSVVGLMPSLQVALSVPTSQLGLLVASYAGGMVVGGPLLGAVLVRRNTDLRRALVALLVLAVVLQLLTALVTGVQLFCVLRFLSGAAGSALFGACLSGSAALVAPAERGRAAAVVLGGLTIGTMIGLPLSSALATVLPWQGVVVAIAVLIAAGLVLVVAVVGPLGSEPLDARAEFAPLREGRLWAALATSALTSCAVFSVFSYLVPFLVGDGGISEGTTAVVLFAYGVATLAGTVVVGRLADRRPLTVAMIGNLALAAVFVAFLPAGTPAPVVVLLVVAVGVLGVSLNPAFAVRVMAIAGPRLLVNTVHSSVINVGILVGSAVASAVVAATGQQVRPVFGVGAAFAALAALSVLIVIVRSRRGAALPQPQTHQQP